MAASRSLSYFVSKRISGSGELARRYTGEAEGSETKTSSWVSQRKEFFRLVTLRLRVLRLQSTPAHLEGR